MTARKSNAEMRTDELMGKLQRHYIVPNDDYDGGIFVPECGRNGAWAGGSASRCDALYVGFTSASGRLLTGHEVKVSRSDWLAEIRKVGKADPWADQCHRWFLVVPTPDIVQPGELPEGWGLMVPGNRTRMKVLVQPVTRDVTPSWDAVRSIMARLDTLQRERLIDVNRQINTRVAEIVPTMVAQRLESSSMVELTPEIREARQIVARFAEVTGIDLKVYTYSESSTSSATPEEFAAAVQVVRSASDLSGPYGTAKHILRQIESLASDLTGLVDGLEPFRDGRRR